MKLDREQLSWLLRLVLFAIFGAVVIYLSWLLSGVMWAGG